MTWIEIKNIFKNKDINPWSFEDSLNSKDKKYLDRFSLAWELIGEKICKDHYKGLNMKYVKFNEENVKQQKQIPRKSAALKHYIFMLDSSSN